MVAAPALSADGESAPSAVAEFRRLLPRCAPHVAKVLLVEESERARQSLGLVKYGSAAAEEASLRLGRSMFIAADMKADDLLTLENLRVVRPGFSAAPKLREELLGRRVDWDLKMVEGMRWDYILGACAGPEASCR